MSGIAKVFVVINLVFSVLVLGSVGALLVNGQDFKADLDKLTTDLEAANKSLSEEQSAHAALKKSYESDNRSFLDQVNDLETNIKAKDDEIASLRREKDQLRGAVDGINATIGDFQTNLDNTNNRNAELTDQLAQLRASEGQATDRQKQAEDELASAQSQITSLTSQIGSLEAQVGDLSNEVEEREMVIASVQDSGFDLSALVSQPAISAVVQAVDYDAQTGTGFVVLSVGEQDGVKPGFKFHVSRGSEYVGDVIVDEVHGDNSVARIKFKNPNAQFRVQDSASTRI